MKRLTVDQTWNECLTMWKWIDGRIKAGDERDVSGLKRAWMSANGFGVEGNKNGVYSDCFFCEYMSHRPGKHINDNCWCPGRLVDKNFTCFGEGYEFDDHPRKFYAELKRLNKIRLAKK